jgi:hypothetical protein
LRFVCAPCAGLWFSLAISALPRAQAQTADSAPEPFTFGAGDCPEPSVVQREVLRLIPPERHDLLRHGVRIELEDLGESYRVRVSKDGTSLKKRYADPARDCDARARFAAVFAVLTLMPPELGADTLSVESPAPPPVAPPKAVIAPPPPPPPAPPLAPLAHVELGALFGYAPAIVGAPELSAFGGELRVALGRGTLQSTLSVAYTSRAKFELRGVTGDLWQLPLSAGLRVSSDLGGLRMAGDLGLLAVVQRVRATDLAASRAASALELGVRGGLTFQAELGSNIAPFCGAFVWLAPAPRELSAAPQGVFGNLPYLWIGGSAGVSFGL